MQDVQREINSAYKACEDLKNEIYLLDLKYKASVSYLETLCRESGLTSAKF